MIVLRNSTADSYRRARVAQLFRQGNDTAQIAKAVNLEEAEVYNLLAKRLPPVKRRGA